MLAVIDVRGLPNGTGLMIRADCGWRNGLLQRTTGIMRSGKQRSAAIFPYGLNAF